MKNCELEGIEEPIISFDTQASISKNFSEQRANDDLGTVIWNDNDPPFSVTEDVMATVLPNPSETDRFYDLP